MSPPDEGTGRSPDPVEMVVITGLSGAGKSEAIAAFEDAGYFCVDNLPPQMIGSLGELFRLADSGVEKAAVVSDARGGEYIDQLSQVVDDLEGDGIKPKLVFLEAHDEILTDRYKETRRRHPSAPDGRIAEGIEREREILAPLRARADLVIDTSGETAATLRRRISDELIETAPGGLMVVNLLTFGFKNGPPRDADITFDVRFLPNPHYVDELRPLTGLDQEALTGAWHDAIAQAMVRPLGEQRPETGRRRSRNHGRRILRTPAAFARIPGSRLRGGRQEPSDDRDRLHRRPAPVGNRGRADLARFLGPQ